jgi:acyl-CoA reductase-like NAD-dependent aldehyde dehydrogenase
VTVATAHGPGLAIDVEELGMLVDGRLVGSSTTFPVVDPTTGEELARCPAASTELVDEAVAAAQAAAPAWVRLGEERRGYMQAIAEVIASHREPLATVLAYERAKTYRDCLSEIDLAITMVDYYRSATIPVDVISDTPTERVTVVREPIGVVAAISPWNSPFQSVVHKMAVGLLVGNTVVSKPSPFTPLSSLALAGLLRDVLPPGVVGMVAGGDDVGEAMCRHPGVNLISFTGSIATGRRIMAAAAPTLTRLSLELGGNDAAIVLPDVDVVRTVPKLYHGAFIFTGQVCAAIKRLYVHADVYESTVEGLESLAKEERLGGPFDEGVTMGPLATRLQRDRVADLVDDAVAHGATVRSGGAVPDRPGFFYPPTIVTGVGRGVRLVDEEQFGPVLPVIPYDDVEWALAEANDSEYGLGGSIWTADLDRGAQLAARMSTGSVWVNRHPNVRPEVPFGGFRQSGLGRERGTAGIEHNCELKVINVLREPA